MVSCLDTYILLQCQYNIIEMLLQGQKNNKLEGQDGVIIDALSVERNYILVKTHIIGGPHERTIPKRTLPTVCTPPQCILPTVCRSPKRTIHTLCTPPKRTHDALHPNVLYPRYVLHMWLLSTHFLDPCKWGEYDIPACGPPASFSVYLAR